MNGMYYIPFSTSTECESLLKKFVTLSNKRGTIELIMKFHARLQLMRMKIKAYTEPLGLRGPQWTELMISVSSRERGGSNDVV